MASRFQGDPQHILNTLFQVEQEAFFRWARAQRNQAIPVDEVRALRKQWKAAQGLLAEGLNTL